MEGRICGKNLCIDMANVHSYEILLHFETVFTVLIFNKFNLQIHLCIEPSEIGITIHTVHKNSSAVEHE